MKFEEVLKLPFEIQMVLVAGYLSYRVATGGLDRAHKPTDIVFQVLAYGLIAYVIYDLFPAPAAPIFSMPAALFFTIAIAAVWRRFGRKLFVGLFRLTRITRENYIPSTWDHLIHESYLWAYVSVICDDDTVYESNLSILPEGLPFESLDVDSGSNIAMYVTRMISPKQESTDYAVPDEYGRARITYIPANRIRNISISFKTNITSSAAMAGAAAQQSASSLD